MDTKSREQAVDLKMKLLREKSRNIERRHQLVEEDKRQAELQGNAVSNKLHTSTRPSKSYGARAYMDEPLDDNFKTSKTYSNQKSHPRRPALRDTDQHEYYDDHKRHHQGDNYQGSRQGGPQSRNDYRQRQYHERGDGRRDDFENRDFQDSRPYHYSGRGAYRSRDDENDANKHQIRNRQHSDQKPLQNKKAIEREQQRRNNIEIMEAQMSGKIQRGDKDWQEPHGFLQDPRREGEGEFQRRPPPRNVQYNPNDKNRHSSRNYPSSSGKIDPMINMTGRQRQDYERWKQQQDEADKERLARSQDEGRWKRAWDNEKNVEVEDNRSERRDYSKVDRGKGRGGYDRRQDYHGGKEHGLYSDQPPRRYSDRDQEEWDENRNTKREGGQRSGSYRDGYNRDQRRRDSDRIREDRPGQTEWNPGDEAFDENNKSRGQRDYRSRRREEAGRNKSNETVENNQEEDWGIEADKNAIEQGFTTEPEERRGDQSRMHSEKEHRSQNDWPPRRRGNRDHEDWGNDRNAKREENWNQRSGPFKNNYSRDHRRRDYDRRWDGRSDQFDKTFSDHTFEEKRVSYSQRNNRGRRRAEQGKDEKAEVVENDYEKEDWGLEAEQNLSEIAKEQVEEKVNNQPRYGGGDRKMDKQRQNRRGRNGYNRSQRGSRNSESRSSQSSYNECVGANDSHASVKPSEYHQTNDPETDKSSVSMNESNDKETNDTIEDEGLLNKEINQGDNSAKELVCEESTADENSIDRTSDRNVSPQADAGDKIKSSRNKVNLKVQIVSKNQQPPDDPRLTRRSSSLTSPLKTPDNFVAVDDWAHEVEISSPNFDPKQPELSRFETVFESHQEETEDSASSDVGESYPVETVTVDESVPLLNSDLSPSVIEHDINKEVKDDTHSDQFSSKTEDEEDDSFHTGESNQDKEECFEYQLLEEETPYEDEDLVNDNIQSYLYEGQEKEQSATLTNEPKTEVPDEDRELSNAPNNYISTEESDSKNHHEGNVSSDSPEVDNDQQTKSLDKDIFSELQAVVDDVESLKKEDVIKTCEVETSPSGICPDANESVNFEKTSAGEGDMKKNTELNLCENINNALDPSISEGEINNFKTGNDSDSVKEESPDHSDVNSADYLEQIQSNVVNPDESHDMSSDGIEIDGTQPTPYETVEED